MFTKSYIIMLRRMEIDAEEKSGYINPNQKINYTTE